MPHAIIYPGTFDPLTNGHLHIIERAAKIFSHVIVAIAESTSKKTLFDIQERVSLAAHALTHLNNVSVSSFNGLLVDFAHQQNVALILRSVRTITDYEYECQLAKMNRALDARIETLFLTPAPEYAYISSTLVREIGLLKGDVSRFVPAATMNALKGKFEN